jgi:hypothetical protein
MSTQCPNCGKRMDSSWRTCPYCTRAQQGKKSDAVPAASPVEQPMTPNDRQHTRVASNVGAAADRKTEMFSEPVAEQRAPRGVADNRKIVGVLVSYTWNPFGTLYEIRQGRNHIGAGDIRGAGATADRTQIRRRRPGVDWPVFRSNCRLRRRSTRSER